MRYTFNLIVSIPIIFLLIRTIVMHIRLAKEDKENRIHSILAIPFALCYILWRVFIILDCSTLVIAAPIAVSCVLAVFMCFTNRYKPNWEDIFLVVAGILILATYIPGLITAKREIYDGVWNHQIYFTHTI